MEKRDLKTRPYNIEMEKKDLKKLTEGQLIKLLMNQGKKPIPRKSINEDIILPPPEQFRDKQKKQRSPKPTRKPPLPPSPKTISILTMTYFKPKTQVLENSKSLAYKADKIKNLKATQTNSKLKSLRSWTTLKRYVTYSKN